MEAIYEKIAVRLISIRDNQLNFVQSDDEVCVGLILSSPAVIRAVGRSAQSVLVQDAYVSAWITLSLYALAYRVELTYQYNCGVSRKFGSIDTASTVIVKLHLPCQMASLGNGSVVVIRSVELSQLTRDAMTKIALQGGEEIGGWPCTVKGQRLNRGLQKTISVEIKEWLRVIVIWNAATAILNGCLLENRSLRFTHELISECDAKERQLEYEAAQRMHSRFGVDRFLKEMEKKEAVEDAVMRIVQKIRMLL